MCQCTAHYMGMGVSDRRAGKNIRFRSYNIRNRSNGGFESDLWIMSQANLYPGIFQYTKVKEGVYARYLARYGILVADAPSCDQGGVAVFYREAEHFIFKALHLHGPNIVRF